MCCNTYVGEANTMATTQLMRAACYKICWPTETRTESRPPRMNWVVVTDENQNRRVQMHWQRPADDC